MCGICGCDEHVPGDARAALHGRRRRASTTPTATAAPRRARGGSSVERSLLADNRARAERLRARLAARGIDAIGLVGGPGAGKTALLEATFARLGREAAAREAVVEGDCATDRDARRVAALRRARRAGGDGRALPPRRAPRRARPRGPRPRRRRAALDRERRQPRLPGAVPVRRARGAPSLVSVPEGDDKPEKYPALFASADLLVVTKADLLPHVDVRRRALRRLARRRVRPGLPHLVVSARTGARHGRAGSPGSGTGGPERVPRGAGPRRRGLRGGRAAHGAGRLRAACASACASRRSPKRELGAWVLVHAGRRAPAPRRGAAEASLRLAGGGGGRGAEEP